MDGLTLGIRRGETVALLGPNGAGKTTATETLLGLIAPDAGEVQMFGGPRATPLGAAAPAPCSKTPSSPRA